MNEREETKITYVEEEDGENDDNGNKVVIGEAGRVVGSLNVLTENLPSLVIQVNEISTCCEVHVVSIILCLYNY